MASFREILARRASETPDLPVFTFLPDGETEGGVLTFQELHDRARAMASRLGPPGGAALLVFDPGLDFITAFFGCLLAGVVAVPAPRPDPRRPERTLPRLRAIIADSKPGIVLATEDPQLGIPWAGERPAVKGWAAPEIDPDALAHLQYTSGSTGAPRGVALSHANLLHACASIRRSAAYDASSVSAVWVPHLHDYGLVEGLLQPVYTGHRCLLMPPAAFVASPLRWLRVISRYGVTHSGGPDFAYELCTRRVRPEERAGLDLSTWRWALNAAEPIRAETLRRFVEAYSIFGFGINSFQPAYGLAEATLQVTNRSGPTFLSLSAAALGQGRVALPGEGRAVELVGSGQPALDTTVVVVNPDTRQPCQTDEVGEIWVRGPGVAQGYYGREDAETFGAHLVTGEGPFLRTGDLGFLHQGELFITGRAKDLMILRGAKHHPQDVEGALTDLAAAKPGMRAGATVAFSVEVQGEERLVVLQEVSAGADTRGLTDAIREVKKPRARKPRAT